MKTFSFLIALLLVPVALGQFAGSDDFDGNINNWGADRVRGSGTFTIADGVLRFSSPQANSVDDIERPWIVGDAPFNASWSVQMDVNVPVIPLQPGSTAVGLGVGVSNNADPNDSFAMFLENIWGDNGQELNYYNRQRTNGQTTENSAPSSSTAVTVRVSWDAVAKRLSAWYDPDGRASGYQWTRLKEFDAVSSWALAGTESFKVFVRGYAESTIVSPSQNVFGDNFRVNDESRAPLLASMNGHYYEMVSGNITWHSAKRDAELRLFNGRRGHLATITSSAENTFIASNFAVSAGGRFAWIGGREPADDGAWIWDAGPETGTSFAQGRAATAPYFYAHWGGIEPNDFKEGEDYLMMNLGAEFAAIQTGQWADAIATPNASDPVLGYIVEYEPEPGPRLQIKLVNPQTVEISFPSSPNRRYQLQALADLRSSAWANSGAAISGDGSVLKLNESVSSNPRFYRVQVVD